jgi:Ca-activated chloride channel homolog
MKPIPIRLAVAMLAILAVPLSIAIAQSVSAPHAGPPFTGAASAVPVSAVSSRAWAANVVVPQVHVYATIDVPVSSVSVAPIHSARPPASGRPASRAIEITGIDVAVVIVEQVATTTMDISLRNLTSSRQEAEILLPVPAKSVIRGFTFQGAATEPKAELLPAAEAKSTYEGIVAKVKDPALLEFAGSSLVRSDVFPLDPNGTQKVRLTYENLLTADGHRVDYELPRTESIDNTIPWTIAVKIKSKQPVATVYSPSHGLEIRRASDGIVSARLSPEAAKQPGPFRLSYLTEADGVSASLMAYPDAKTGGGYFLLLAGVPQVTAKEAASIKREITLVLDRSGSMTGGKIEQVREAARQVIGGLAEGEAFNIIPYNDTIESFSGDPVLKDKESAARAEKYIAAIQARGGTNIHDALLEALRAKPREGFLPIVLFLTDGLPTVGQTSEVAIRDVAMKSNPYNRRIFAFGVGVDVNAPLLDKISVETRGMATFVMPKEDVEVKVGQVFKRLIGPVLADPRITTQGAGRITDMVPSKVPDLFSDDQIVLCGRYTKSDEPLVFELTGNYMGKERKFRFKFDLASATTRNAFVPRLWASRRIATLVDAISQMGAGGPGKAASTLVTTDPKLKELVDEIVKLSTEFGILTEYTSFLAREGTDLSKKDDVMAQATRNFQDRAIATRSGVGGVNQAVNAGAQRGQSQLNMNNEFFDSNMNRVSISSVQQVNDRAFYQRGGRWVDSEVLDKASAAPAETIEYGSEAFHRLAARLASENRAGTIALRGDILMNVDGKLVLVKAPAGEK